LNKSKTNELSDELPSPVIRSNRSASNNTISPQLTIYSTPLPAPSNEIKSEINTGATTSGTASQVTSNKRVYESDVHRLHQYQKHLHQMQRQK